MRDVLAECIRFMTPGERGVPRELNTAGESGPPAEFKAPRE